MPTSLTFLDAAARVLHDTDEPLHYRVITEQALAKDLVQTQGKTPADTMNAQISVSIKSKGDASRFVRVRPGIYGLRTWVEEGRIAAWKPPATGSRSSVIHYTGLQSVRGALAAWDGVSPAHVTELRRQIDAIVKESDVTLDWKDPDAWIDERLTGEAQILAHRMWQGGAHPRYTSQPWRIALAHGLLVEGPVLTVTEDGRSLVDNPHGDVVARIDVAEGMLDILGWIAEQGPIPTSELMPAWSEWHTDAGIQLSDSTLAMRLRYRITDLVERDLVQSEGRSWRITEAGLSWLRNAGDIDPDSGADERQTIRELVDSQRREVREALSTALSEMNPYAFEALISRLLDRMGYLDAEVTSPSNDNGVDVVAKVEFGITSITEVVQVKRQKANVGRPVLDGLRGSLYRFAAQRGTIITTSGFSKGAKEAALHAGAAPITLIDGEKLVELLVRHELGIRKKNIEVWELDESTLTVDEVEE